MIINLTDEDIEYIRAYFDIAPGVEINVALIDRLARRISGVRRFYTFLGEIAYRRLLDD
ncbi:MAG: hypothetical protein ABGX63_05745 [bacterium]